MTELLGPVPPLWVPCAFPMKWRIQYDLTTAMPEQLDGVIGKVRLRCAKQVEVRLCRHFGKWVGCGFETLWR